MCSTGSELGVQILVDYLQGGAKIKPQNFVHIFAKY